MTETVSQHVIAGAVLSMPVRIRKAVQHAAMFSVDAEAAQRLIDYSGLRVCRYLPGRALVVLTVMDYIDGDLGRYHEYATNVMVDPPGVDHAPGSWSPRGLRSAGAFCHHMPVDQPFTLEAGITIWGYPKVMADFTIRDGRQFGFDLSIDGRDVLGMEFEPGLPIPSSFTSAEQVRPTYSYRDGVVRETEGAMRLSGVRYRPGGARLRLSDHPYANDLASLGLPKRALVSSSAENVEMTFADPHEITGEK